MTCAGAPDLALVHLVRQANDLSAFESFLDSYERHPAGCDHQLVLLFKGFGAPADAAPYLRRAEPHDPTAVYLDDVGFDLSAYRTAASRLGQGVLAFVNSHSRVLVDGWLDKLARPVRDGSAGLAGATGSWASNLAFGLWQMGLPGGYADVYEVDRRAARRAMFAIAGARFRSDVLYSIHNTVNVLRELPYSALFPSMHVRTNAFVIGQATMLSLPVRRLDTKLATYRWENGRGNLTASVRATGREAVVVDRHGVARTPAHWHKADVFWQGCQEDLLVSDNQTRSYADAVPALRDVLCRFAWGPAARPWPVTT